MLTPLELIEWLAALIPPPRRHHHRYFGVLAPNARCARRSPRGRQSKGRKEPIHRRAACYAWALLLARIYGVFPLLCLNCGGEMRIIAFITEAAAVRDILAQLGEPTSPPRMAAARGPPLWQMPDAGKDLSTHTPNRRRTTNSISASPGRRHGKTRPRQP